MRNGTGSDGDTVICRGDRTSDWSGCGRGSRDVERPGGSSGKETGEGNKDRRYLAASAIFLKRLNPELRLGEPPLLSESGPPWKGWAAGQTQRGGWREVASAAKHPGKEKRSIRLPETS